MKLQLIPYWRQAWRLWSVRFATLGALLWAYLLASPESITQVWYSLPDEMKALIPVNWQRWLTFFIFVASALSRIVQQNKAAAVVEQAMTEKVASGEVDKVTLYKPAE